MLNPNTKSTQPLLLSVLLAIATLCSLSAHPRDYIIYKYNDFGLFAVFNNVLGMLDEFDQGKCAGVKVDLVNGLYSEPKMGPNWWNYYFQSVQVGHNGGYVNSSPDTGFYGPHTLCKMDRQRGNYLINKYIKVKPYISHLVNRFYNQNLTNAFLIGIHYRGTDKSSEAARVDYEKVVKTLQYKINQINGKTYKIFVASDEQKFVDHIKNKFSNVYYTNSIRSTNGAPVHYNNNAHFQHGLECVIDVLLLARCNTIIRTASNVSSAVSMLNPNVEFITLNEHIWANCHGRSY
ncbi:hypothetical protein H0X48_06920 [Candidatus Dependentiae bacterium]|nr:hypothetical protein [Candidatus Dependentiae bacterium]